MKFSMGLRGRVLAIGVDQKKKEKKKKKKKHIPY